MDQILDALLLACFLLCGIYALGTGFALRRQHRQGPAGIRQGSGATFCPGSFSWLPCAF